MRLHRRLGFWGMFLTLGAVSLALSFRGGPLAAYAYALDSDADGLSNDFEDAYGTDPFDEATMVDDHDTVEPATVGEPVAAPAETAPAETAPAEQRVPAGV